MSTASAPVRTLALGLKAAAAKATKTGSIQQTLGTITGLVSGSANYVSVTLGADTTPVPSVRYQGGYGPAVGHVVVAQVAPGGVPFVTSKRA